MKPTGRVEGTTLLAGLLRLLADLTTPFASGRRRELTLREELLLSRREDEGEFAVAALDGLVFVAAHGFLEKRRNDTPKREGR
jgi:hypothetical protein